jgi:hypothetical protein
VSFKYTKDGKKVSIVGQLNSTEYIVQEIFVTDSGDEIPCGEKFTEKSLFDAPIKSWKEKDSEEKCLRFSERIEKLKKDSELANKKLLEVEKKLSLKKQILMQSDKIINAIEKHNGLALIPDFLSGEIEWIVDHGYTIPKLINFYDLNMTDDDFSYYRGKKIDLKLFSIFGDSDGNIKYKINQYGDGSGYWTTIEFFKGKEDALNRVKELFLKKNHFNTKDIKELIEIGVKFTDVEKDLITKKLKLFKKDKLEKIKSSYEVENSRLLDESKAIDVVFE